MSTRKGTRLAWVLVLATAFVAVGFLVATREPTNPLWLRHGVTR